MNFEDFIVAPLIGAVIGYFTNWLAIKMLFRPHNEIRLFGIKLPFTPGLIPKERYNLSKKVGETVGKHLITKEVLTEAVLAPEIIENINKMIDNLLSNLAERNQTIEELINSFAKNSKGDIINNTKKIAVTNVNNFIISQQFTDGVSLAVTNNIVDFLKGSDKSQLSEKLEAILSKYIDENAEIKKYIPDKIIEIIKAAVNNNIPKLGGILKDFITNNPKVDEKLNSLVCKIIDDNFNGLIGIFINKDKIYSSIKDGLFKYLNDPESQQQLYESCDKVFDEFLNKNIGYLFERLPVNFKEELLTKIIEKIDENVTPAFETNLNKYIANSISKFTKESGEKIVSTTIDFALDKLLSLHVNDVSEKIKPENIKKIINKGINILLSHGAAFVVEHLNIDKLTENKINSFEVSEAEDIILSVVKRELNAITIVGGVLGFVIGFMPVVLQLLR